MAADIALRLVAVEFLRPGPANNQLLSPLTPYLAICGDSDAGVVTVPYEHSRFERRLRELRYETGEPETRADLLHEIGSEMAKILGAVPGLPGAIRVVDNARATLIHLRITASASELALLPFELSKIPVSAGASGEGWLAIQTRPPVCMTRNIRTVSPEGVVWPDTPRILFISAEPSTVPYTEHRRELLRAIAPFRYPARTDAEDALEDATSANEPRQVFGELLTILVDPTLSDVLNECRTVAYTHVHVLTHGDHDGLSQETYGLVLRGTDGSPHVVSGDQFATALNPITDGGIHRPTVVTVASCDSANVGSVIVPGASVAHAVHQSGVPFVVASQFPLSQEGSVPMAATIYEGLLWGAHPLVLLHRLRAELHARYTATWHDWASLVVYEALPLAFEEQLDGLRYWQARRAMNAGLERIDRGVRAHASWSSLELVERSVHDAIGRLPLEGHYSVECVGLRASARKRLAQASFVAAADRTGTGVRQPADSYDLLEEALRDYDEASLKFLVNDARTQQRIATLHWVLVQYVSLSVVLGSARREGTWRAARLAAEVYLDHESREERAWAHGSLAELWLLRLTMPGSGPETPADCREKALHHAREITRVYPSREEFPVTSTRRQVTRYIQWWGTDRFIEELESRDVPPRASWEGEPGLLTTAREIVAILERKRSRPGPPGPSGSVPPPESGPAPEPSPIAPLPNPPQQEARETLSASRPTRSRPSRGPGPFFDIEMLPAAHGDCLWIEYGDDANVHRWLMDCGTRPTAATLLRKVEDVPANERFLELFVMSHIDSDHIGGALPLFRAVRDGLRFGDVWFNGWRQLAGQLGARQGEMFSTAIQDFELPWNVFRDGAAIVIPDGAELPEYVLPGGMRLTLLSPTPAGLRKLAPVWTREMKRYGLAPGSRVDYSMFLKGTPSSSTDVDALASEKFGGDNGAPNGTSIAVLAEFGGTSALLAADAHAPVLAASVKKLINRRGGNRLKVGAFKVSHHASQNNVSTELVQLLDCPRYLVSTNGDHFFHPDRQAIARIIKHGGPDAAIYFNYATRFNEVWAEASLQAKYGYTTHYPPVDEPGLTVSLLPSS